MAARDDPANTLQTPAASVTRSKVNRPSVLRKESPQRIEPDIEKVAGWPKLLSAFRQATGWSLKYHRGPEPTHPTDHTWSAPVNPGVGATPGHVRLDLVRSASAASGTERAPAAVKRLASAVAEMLSELLRTRRALWQREAELAAGVPVVVRPDEEKHLAARLQAVLRGGAEAVGCHAAALYLLDEATTSLKLRSSWGLPPERLADPPRPLQGALADLEAMLGHAVVLEDTDLLPDWNPPEDFPSAACVPVATGATILGTLWVFCQTRRDFNDRETNILEVVAGRVAADLQREMLLHESIQGALFQREMAAAERIQRGQLPAIPPLLEGWDIGGWAPQTGRPRGDFFDWFSIPDGLTAVALGAVSAGGLEGALTAGTLRGAIRAHGQYHRDPDALLRQVNLTLWTASAGDLAASLFCGLIDAREGLIRYAAAGEPGVFLLESGAWRPLLEATLPLGSGPEAAYSEGGHRLQGGEVVLALSLKDRLPGEAGQTDHSAAGAILTELPNCPPELPAKEFLILARQAIQSGTRECRERLGAMLVVKRRYS
jgi:hypothetical protein